MGTCGSMLDIIVILVVAGVGGGVCVGACVVLAAAAAASASVVIARVCNTHTIPTPTIISRLKRESSKEGGRALTRRCRSPHRRGQLCSPARRRKQTKDLRETLRRKRISQKLCGQPPSSQGADHTLHTQSAWELPGLGFRQKGFPRLRVHGSGSSVSEGLGFGVRVVGLFRIQGGLESNLKDTVDDGERSIPAPDECAAVESRVAPGSFPPSASKTKVDRGDATLQIRKGKAALGGVTQLMCADGKRKKAGESGGGKGGWQGWDMEGEVSVHAFRMRTDRQTHSLSHQQQNLPEARTYHVRRAAHARSYGSAPVGVVVREGSAVDYD